MSIPSSTDECPFCGARLSENATRCRSCGASDEYGWNSIENNLDDFDRESFEDDFDYDEFVAREFPDQSESGTAAATGLSMTARFVILGLVISLILAFVFS